MKIKNKDPQIVLRIYEILLEKEYITPKDLDEVARFQIQNGMTTPEELLVIMDQMEHTLGLVKKRTEGSDVMWNTTKHSKGTIMRCRMNLMGDLSRRIASSLQNVADFLLNKQVPDTWIRYTSVGWFGWCKYKLVFMKENLDPHEQSMKGDFENLKTPLAKMPFECQVFFLENLEDFLVAAKETQTKTLKKTHEITTRLNEKLQMFVEAKDADSLSAALFPSQ
jgi:hypothetical protein